MKQQQYEDGQKYVLRIDLAMPSAFRPRGTVFLFNSEADGFYESKRGKKLFLRLWLIEDLEKQAKRRLLEPLNAKQRKGGEAVLAMRGRQHFAALGRKSAKARALKKVASP